MSLGDGVEIDAMLVVKAPTTPTLFTQVVARLDRDGQEDVVNCRVAMARGTAQVRMFDDLLAKDALAPTAFRAVSKT
ncbi:hypothetical protein [Hydrogenophaga sp. BPS33]|uniref:hypothetical protein n=1 Tax=Hydrogenophaga sp. BPS33 TaxID=2651974 RepID=UPI00132049C4|nr:hypothetical protein [Hydrogenophaga sp. BPS33]QHE87189.1 hypothetical protein F9K07_20940 [Hydrogenophaga sp. BPS33]